MNVLPTHHAFTCATLDEHSRNFPSCWLALTSSVVTTSVPINTNDGSDGTTMRTRKMAPGPDVPTSDRNKFSCSSINVVVAVVFVTRAFPLWLQGRNLPRGRKGKYFDVIIILSHHFEINIHRGDRQTVLARVRGWYFFFFFFIFYWHILQTRPRPHVGAHIARIFILALRSHVVARDKAREDW